MPRLRWCSQGQASSISPQCQPGQRAKKAKWGGQGAWLPWCQTIQRGPVRVLPRYTDGARTLLWYQNPAGRDGKWSTQFGKKNYRQNSSFKDGTGGLKTSPAQGNEPLGNRAQMQRKPKILKSWTVSFLLRFASVWICFPRQEAGEYTITAIC